MNEPELCQCYKVIPLCRLKFFGANQSVNSMQWIWDLGFGFGLLPRDETMQIEKKNKKLEDWL